MVSIKLTNRLESIENEIFKHSFQQNKSLERLGKIYLDLIEIKNQFLTTNFIEFEKSELEEIRYRINESILNIKILIREKKGLNIDSDIRQMKELLGLYQ